MNTTVAANSDLQSSNSNGAATAPFIWSMKREIWENKSIYIAPLIVAGVILFGALISAGHLPQRRQTAMLLDDVHRRMAIELPYNIAAGAIVIAVFGVGLFYCLDALYGERRERSILFWKSLPVSDVTTVLSKASIPLLVLPPIAFVIITVTQFVMLLISSAVLAPSGLASTTWANFNILQQSVILAYSLIVITLWHAPIYGWALLMSGVARRATFLWAVLPPFAMAAFEKFTFNTSYIWSLVKHRIAGAGETAFNLQHSISITSLSQLTPGRFFVTPGLWIGLVFAAGFIVAAIRVRRYRGPI